VTSYVTEDMRRSMADKVLSIVAEYEGMAIYRLGPADGSWMESTRILISREPLAEQIIITGDLCPGANGILSNFGYGVRWFGRKQSEEYLCSKFLRREWVPEAAVRALQYSLQEEIDSSDRDDSDVRAARIETLGYAIDCIGDEPSGEQSVARNSEAFYEFWADTFGDSPEDQGMDYNPRDAGWLCAIQQRFAECYQALQSAKSALS
jgi:hypothetical protein